MKKIDIFNLPKYLKRTGDNKLARVGHVNYALEEIEKLKEEIKALAPIKMATIPGGGPTIPKDAQMQEGGQMPAGAEQNFAKLNNEI